MFSKLISHAEARDITLNIDAIPITLEPPLIQDTNAMWIVQNVGERLVEEHIDGELKGVLAKKWFVSKNYKKWIFQLNEDHKFSDGTKLDAQAVVRSLERTLDIGPAGRVGHFIRNIEKIKALNSYTIQFELRAPIGQFLRLLSDASFSIYKKNCSNSLKICFSNSKLEIASLSDKEIKIKRNADGQNFTFYPLKMVEAIAQFKSGQLDVIRNYGLQGLAEVQDLATNILKIKDERTYFIAFNSQSEIFKHKYKRLQYISQIDKKKLTSIMQKYSIEISKSLLSPSLQLPGSKNAEDYINETISGHKFLNVQGLSLLTSGLDVIKDIFPKGSISFKFLPKLDFVSKMNSGQYDVLLVGYGITVRDIMYIGNYFYSETRPSFAKIKSKEIDNLINTAVSISDLKQRRNLIHKVLQINAKQGYIFPLFHLPLCFGFNSRIKSDYNSNQISSPFLDLNKIWIINEKK